MSAGEEFAKAKIIFNDLKIMIERLDELNRNGVISK